MTGEHESQSEKLRWIVNEAIELLGDKGEEMMVTNAIVIASVVTADGDEKMYVKATQAAPWTLMGLLSMASGQMDQMFFGGKREG
jgi:hypothetical protein